MANFLKTLVRRCLHADWFGIRDCCIVCMLIGARDPIPLPVPFTGLAVFRPLLMGQIEFADVIVLNKSDLVTKKQAKSIKAAIRTLNPAAEVVMATRGNVPLETVLCTGFLGLGLISTGFIRLVLDLGRDLSAAHARCDPTT